MRDLNIALIGGGFMGKAHSLAYAAMPMYFWPAPARPVRKVIVDVSEDLARTAADRYGWERHATSWQDVVADPSVDVVDIATPNHLHADIAIAAAEAGKHVICEKPLAPTAADAQRMLEAVQKAGVVHAVAFNYRRTPAVALAKKYVEEGAIGEVLNFRGTYLQDWSADLDSPLSWRFQKAIAGSGAVGDIGSHVVDLARYLVGEVDEVSSLVSRFIHDRPLQSSGFDSLGASRGSDGPRGAVDVDDESITMLRFCDGAVGSIEATRNAWGRNNYITFEIHGTEGTIFFNYERRDELQVAFKADPADRRGFRTVYTGPGTPYGESLWPIPALGIGYSETKIIEAYEIFKAIAEGGSVRPDFADGYQTALVDEAILASGRTGAWTAVDQVEREGR
ncbi:Gfo/Idh/MocA family oxidoreductase [Streptomyces sp. NP160]|uniref:Gfo/Idh/MocA family protein n=1 Tax=Streptomyces sp. NP160 TaxID=2586637 RepID=UPI00111811D9|nr:Gfo/Idh/MocA family oxidoreductase [Streptomyces sp. NP160]TNM67074.1 Gfo/Idh/MocA family oxidoreductase [Streptomyces sp. NP160]